MQTILSFHRFLQRHCFYPLLTATLLGFAFVIYRYAVVDRLQYRFLVWNLFLAWIPYWISLVTVHLHERRPSASLWRLSPLMLGWLLFLPNAPYIFTDLKHFPNIQPLTWWYDLGLMVTFAWTGCFLGVVSLHIMQSIVRDRVGWIASQLFVLASVLLSGLGIYIGRFLRWNSWDILTNPRHIAGDMLVRLDDPRTIGVTLMFAGILFVCYYLFATVRTPVDVRVKR